MRVCVSVKEASGCRSDLSVGQGLVDLPRLSGVCVFVCESVSGVSVHYTIVLEETNKMYVLFLGA